MLASLYVSLTCLVWGCSVVQLLSGRGLCSEALPHTSILCLTGAAAISVAAGYLSLVMPLGGWLANALIFSITLLMLLRSACRQALRQAGEECRRISALPLILFIVCTVALLVLGSSRIVQADTIGYHAQTIQWIQKYRAIPGLVHLDSRLGYQGLWFTTGALFGFSFLGSSSVSYINSATLLWYLFLVTSRVSDGLRTKETHVRSLLWLALLGISLFSFTQLRLAATSSSPDFVAALFIWAVIYLLVQRKPGSGNGMWLLISFLCCAAVSIKASAAPLLGAVLIAAFFLCRDRQMKSVCALSAVVLLTLIPFVARNMIASGYAVFPARMTDICDTDWKYDNQLTGQEKDAITAFAKVGGSHTPERVAEVNRMQMSEWAPLWWKNRSPADKAIVIAFLLALCGVLLGIRKVMSADSSVVLALLVCVSGVVFWLATAPDPRFGCGFLIGFVAVSANFVSSKVRIGILFPRMCLMTAILGVSVLSGYWFKKSHSGNQWVRSRGMEQTEYTTVQYNGMRINVPVRSRELGIVPIPCSDLSGAEFVPRGDAMTDGFRAR